MQDWMEGRHRDLHLAMSSGRLLEVARISSLVTEVARDWETRQANMSDDEIALRTALGEGRFCPVLSVVRGGSPVWLPRITCG